MADSAFPKPGPEIRPKTVVSVRPVTARRLVNVQFDDGWRVTVRRRDADNAGAATGVTLLPPALEQLRKAEQWVAELLALQRIGAADRTVRELREYLAVRGFSQETIAQVVDRMEANRVVDHQRTAEGYVAMRTGRQPRSRRMLKAELSRRGIQADVAENAIASVDDEASARDLVLRRGGRAPKDSYEAFEKYLGPYLQRRGYGYETALRAIRSVWEMERSEGGAGGFKV